MNKLRINKLGVLSIGKMHGAMALVIGLIIGVLYGLFFMLFGGMAMMGGGRGGLAAGGSSIIVGLIIMIAVPLIYGCIGFIGGIISAFIYNIFAGVIGGIEIEVENIP